MTLIDLNQMEISLIIELLKFDIRDLNRIRSANQIREWTNHIQSVICKLEKGLQQK